MGRRFTLFLLTFLTVFMAATRRSLAQCSNPYKTYPVTFDFESSDGGWFSGGDNNDWTWGKPAKPVINTAASGQKCWVIGSLTRTGYKSNEASWLQSPRCFDFSNLDYPAISFKIFWEMERQYDGAAVQYSTDYGSTWKNIGGYNETGVCASKNWFNYPSINYLANLSSSKEGWSGNIQPTSGICQGGGGSKTWVTASHDLYNLKGQTHVMFRFIFGSGSSCNNFDGIAIDDVTISNLPPNPIFTVSHTNTGCSNSKNGTATVNVSSGTAPYTYKWTMGAQTFTGSSLNNLSAGFYTVNVTDAAGCKGKDTVTIRTPAPLSLDVKTKAATCGLSNGGLNIINTGGTPPYAYTWKPNVASGNSAANLAAGTYVINITDAGSCNENFSFTIVDSIQFSATVTDKKDVTCKGAATGFATVTPSGSSGPYTYAWTPSGGNTATAASLPAGNYSVVVKDPNGCMATANTTISEPATGLTMDVSSSPATTCGNDDGFINVSNIQGASPYSTSWSPATYTGNSLTNLPSGTYKVTVKDAGNCETSSSVTIAPSTAIVVSSISPTDALCNGSKTGGAKASVTGGSGVYTYHWTGFNVDTTGSQLANVSAGKYGLAVKDDKGCTATSSATIGEPTALQHTVSITAIDCSNKTGSATINESGGKAPYTYSWTPAGGNAATANNLQVGDYAVTITDANGCSETVKVSIASKNTLKATASLVSNVSCFGGSNGSVTAAASGGSGLTYSWSPIGGSNATADNLVAGTYTVTVSSAEGCAATASVVVTEPPKLTVTSAEKPVSCNAVNGEASVTATGGTEPYTYLWKPTDAKTPTIDNIAAGTYAATITDARGCTVNESVVVTSVTDMKLGTYSSKVSCAGTMDGIAAAVVTGGAAPYTFKWSNGAITDTIKNLAGGNYPFTITDATGCSVSGSVSVSEPDSVKVSIVAATATCNRPNGNAVAAATGGVRPYQYSWSTGTNDSTLHSASAGDYSLQVMDSYGCVASGSVAIPNIGGVSPVISKTNVSCYGLNDGLATVDPGTSMPATFAWTPGLSSKATISNLRAGSYKVTVTDTVGCTASVSTLITQPARLGVYLGSDTLVCPGYKIVYYPGKFASYTWQDGSRDTAYAVTVDGLYSVSVTDAAGCTATATVNVTTDCRDIVFPNSFTPNRDGHNDGFGPLGTLSALKNFRLNVYNRWGQLMFATTNPYQKWNGTFKGAELGTGTYVWMSSFTFNGRPNRVAKGSILLIR